MSIWRQLKSGLRVLTRRGAADQDLTDEVQHYLDQAAAAHRARGLSPDAALRAARLELGNMTGVRETVRSNGWENAIGTLLADLRYACRRLAHRPAFSMLTVGTLALGIGATTAIFSVVDPILFQPLPYPHSDRVMSVWEPSEGLYGRMGFTTATDIEQGVRSFEYVAASDLATATLTGPAEAELVVGERVSWTFFRALGVRPTLGRDFLKEEDVPNAARVVVLSNGLWRRRFGGDSGIIGRSISLGVKPMTVIGVMPAGFESMLQPDAQIWIPLRYNVTTPGACRDCRHLRVIARLEPGVTQSAAQQEVTGIFQRLKQQYPDIYLQRPFQVVSLRDYTVRDVRSVLLAVLGAVGFVLLIACVNVTNLLLAQGIVRRAEFAVRTALGAGRRRLVRQMLTESVLLAALGGTIGIGLALFGAPALLALSPPGLPLQHEIAVNAPVLIFALVLTGVVGIAFGLVPALHLASAGLTNDMQGSSRRTVGGTRTTRVTLVVSEVALALVLLVGSGLLLQSLRRLFAVQPGFDPARVLTLQIQTGGPRLATDSSTWAYYDQVLAAVRALPGVESAALTSQLPLSGDIDQYGVHSEPRPGVDMDIEHPGYRYGVSDGYFATMRIPLLRGRTFTTADRGGQLPVAVIDETMSRHGWGGLDPIGHRVRIGPTDQGPWYTIVGVVADVKQQSLAAASDNAIYVPEFQWLSADDAMSLVVTTTVDPAAMFQTLRRTIWSVDKDQPIVREAMLSTLLADTAARQRFALVLFEAFALVALVLAGAGIYGVLAGSVCERAREIGVRAALGASRAEVVWLVLRQGMTMTVLGIGIGLIAAAGLSRVIGTLLFNTPHVDPVTYSGVTVLLAGVALLACWIPAARAASVDPMEVLRAE